MLATETKNTDIIKWGQIFIHVLTLPPAQPLLLRKNENAGIHLSLRLQSLREREEYSKRQFSLGDLSHPRIWILHYLCREAPEFLFDSFSLIHLKYLLKTFICIYCISTEDICIIYKYSYSRNICLKHFLLEWVHINPKYKVNEQISHSASWWLLLLYKMMP